MKILKFALYFLAVKGQSLAYSQALSNIPFYEIPEIVSTEIKYILCVNSHNNIKFFWAKNSDGSYKFVRGNIHNEVIGVNTFSTPVVTDLFKIELKYLKDIAHICPKNYYAQPADSYSKKLYQILYISTKNEYFIFPGQTEVQTIKNKKIDLDSLTGLAIG